MDDLSSHFQGFQLVCFFLLVVKGQHWRVTSVLRRLQETLVKIAAEISSTLAVMAGTG